MSAPTETEIAHTLSDLNHCEYGVAFHYDGDINHVWFAHYCSFHEMAVAGYLPISTDGWALVNLDPLTVAPSIHCAPKNGCGLHGYIRGGVWKPC